MPKYLVIADNHDHVEFTDAGKLKKVTKYIKNDVIELAEEEALHLLGTGLVPASEAKDAEDAEAKKEKEPADTTGSGKAVVNK